MYCLTLKHPWPFAVCFLKKDVENRRWRAPARHVGERLLIHGGIVPREPGARLAALETACELADAHRYALRDLEDRVFACTGIVANVLLEKCVVSSASPWFHGPFGWLLRDVVVFPEPVPCLGRQGLWELPANLREAVGRATEAGRRAKACR